MKTWTGKARSDKITKSLLPYHRLRLLGASSRHELPLDSLTAQTSLVWNIGQRPDLDHLSLGSQVTQVLLECPWVDFSWPRRRLALC